MRLRDICTVSGVEVVCRSIAAPEVVVQPFQALCLAAPEIKRPLQNRKTSLPDICSKWYL